MKIVIDIDDDIYKSVVNNDAYVLEEDVDWILLENAIANGTPLPKHHGDLIDRSKICKAIPAEEDNCTGMGMTYDEMDAYNDGIDSMWDKLQSAKPIIEADKCTYKETGCGSCKRQLDCPIEAEGSENE